MRFKIVLDFLKVRKRFSVFNYSVSKGIFIQIQSLRFFFFKVCFSDKEKAAYENGDVQKTHNLALFAQELLYVSLVQGKLGQRHMSLS